MPRTKKIKPIEERIGEAREDVFRAKDRYDAAVKKLNELLEKKREMEGKELLEAFAQTKKPLSMILEFMREEAICQMQDVVETVGGIEVLREFVLSENNDSCLDIDMTRRLSEEDALRVAAGMLGENPQRVALYPKEKRDNSIRQMHGSGLTVMQISRLTGIGRKIVRRAIEQDHRGGPPGRTTGDRFRWTCDERVTGNRFR